MSEKCPDCGERMSVPSDSPTGEHGEDWKHKRGWIICITRQLDQAILREKKTAALVKEMIRQRDEVQAIVDKLPKTADGVPVTPGMELWGPAFVAYCKQNNVPPYPSLSDCVVRPGEYYSTLDLAEKAAAAEAARADR